jgi:hypothetical protein
MIDMVNFKSLRLENSAARNLKNVIATIKERELTSEESEQIDFIVESIIEAAVEKTKEIK